tara:strand:+ start:1550 stop:1705 length:156 start_codon:yes stop_codon:yes gene_type:complete
MNRKIKKYTALERISLLEKVVYNIANKTEQILRAIELTEKDIIKKEDKGII